IITIVVRSENPDLAARLANAIAEAHVARLTGLVIEDTADASQWLSDEIDKLRTLVSDAEARVAAYRVENDLFVGSNNTSLLDQQLSEIARQITEAQQRRSAVESRANVLTALIQAGQP